MPKGIMREMSEVMELQLKKMNTVLHLYSGKMVIREPPSVQ